MSGWRRTAGIVCTVSGGFMFFGGAILAGNTVPIPGSHGSYAPYLIQGMTILLWGLALFFVGVILVAIFAEGAVAPRTYLGLRIGGIACLALGLLLITVAVYAYNYSYLGACDVCGNTYPYQSGAVWTAILSGAVLIPGIILLATSWPRPRRWRRV